MRSVIATTAVLVLAFGALIACGGGGGGRSGGFISTSGELSAQTPTQATPLLTTAAPTTAAPTSAEPSASASASPSASATSAASATATPSATPERTETPTQVPTQATPTPTASPSPSPTPSPTPSPSPTLAACDACWPPKSISAIQPNEAPITGRVVHANGTGAGRYCLILTSGPCAATTDSNGNFALKFASGFGAVAINIVVKGKYDAGTSDGPVVGSQSVTMSASGLSGITITVP